MCKIFISSRKLLVFLLFFDEHLKLCTSLMQFNINYFFDEHLKLFTSSMQFNINYLSQKNV